VSGEAWYFVTFIDDFTRYVEVNILEKKSQTPSLLLSFIRRAERHFSGKNYKVANIRSDHGGEYFNSTLKDYFEEHGIYHQLSVPGNSPQNGVAERMNRTLRDKAKYMLSESGLPSMFWDEAILTADYLYNRVIHSGSKTTPYQN
jgi:transposase InsO family protein